MSEYPIGATIQQGENEWRVVRIITGSTTLFEDRVTGPYLVTESYIELKAPDGNVGFVQLTRDRVAYEGPISTIKGLEPINFGDDI